MEMSETEIRYIPPSRESVEFLEAIEATRQMIATHFLYLPPARPSWAEAFADWQSEMLRLALDRIMAASPTPADQATVPSPEEVVEGLSSGMVTDNGR